MLVGYIEELIANRMPINETLVSDGCGIYCLFARDLQALPGINLPPTGVIYSGMTKDSFRTRNHFVAKNSGFHSPRRSLGAILKHDLSLRAVPRALGPSPTNYRCYSFTADGEKRLSNWMFENLDYASVCIADDIRIGEAEVIRTLNPPLNLTLWRNPQKPHIMALRKLCVLEAKVRIA